MPSFTVRVASLLLVELRTSSALLWTPPARTFSFSEQSVADSPVSDCDVADGSAFSSSYPCRCGGSTCHRGQACTSASSSCETAERIDLKWDLSQNASENFCPYSVFGGTQVTLFHTGDTTHGHPVYSNRAGNQHFYHDINCNGGFSTAAWLMKYGTPPDRCSTHDLDNDGACDIEAAFVTDKSTGMPSGSWILACTDSFKAVSVSISVSTSNAAAPRVDMPCHTTETTTGTSVSDTTITTTTVTGTTTTTATSTTVHSTTVTTTTVTATMTSISSTTTVTSETKTVSTITDSTVSETTATTTETATTETTSATSTTATGTSTVTRTSLTTTKTATSITGTTETAISLTSVTKTATSTTVTDPNLRVGSQDGISKTEAASGLAVAVICVAAAVCLGACGVTTFLNRRQASDLKAEKEKGDEAGDVEAAVAHEVLAETTSPRKEKRAADAAPISHQLEYDVDCQFLGDRLEPGLTDLQRIPKTVAPLDSGFSGQSNFTLSLNDRWEPREMTMQSPGAQWSVRPDADEAVIDFK